MEDCEFENGKNTDFDVCFQCVERSKTRVLIAIGDEGREIGEERGTLSGSDVCSVIKFI